MNDFEYIKEKLSQEELLCQLAEEASELAQAALKLRRVYDGSNPTPVKRSEAFNNLKEEVADVLLCLDTLNMNAYNRDYSDFWNRKIHRWAKRLREKRGEENHDS